MRFILRTLSPVIAIALTVGPLSAQTTGSVTGLVTDGSSRQPVSGVEVSVVGSNLSTLTNQEGRYILLNVPVGQRVVRVGVIGYHTDEQAVEVRVGEASVVNFALRVEAIGLDEVVVNAVTGRTERKRELGTNTATISAADIARAPITKMADVLAGRTAGVQLQGVAGSVGTSQRIRIRGANSISLSNEPLIYVDGVQFSNNKGGFGVGGQDYSRLNDLNAEDIANIEVLKGPAASALYGTAAANGVILITTRRGSAGAAQWRAYAETGVSEDKNDYPVNFLPFQINDPSAPVFTARGNLNQAAPDENTQAPYVYCPNVRAAAGTCRQDELLALNPFTTASLTPFSKGNRQKYGISVGGGTETVNYYVSGDYDTERGVIRFNEQDRVSLRTNVGARVLENLGLNLTASYARTNLQLNANDNNIFSPLINGLLATPFEPTQEQREASVPGQRPGTGFGYFLSDIEEVISDQNVDRFVIGGSTNYQPIAWLSLNANVGMDYFSRFDQTTVQPGRLPIAATWTPGFRNAQRSSNYIWTSNAAGVASFDLTNDLASTTTLGGSFSREQFESTFCRGVGIVEGTRSCSATSSLFSVSEGFSEVRTIGGYLQQQLNWRDRLIVSGSIRGDDNSAFGQDFGFIYYPGVSLSWVASEEPFFPQVGFLSNLRLRTAYGKSGQRPNFRDAITLLDPVSVTSNNQEQSAVRLSRIGNPDLKPERTTEVEAGFDLGLFDDRLGVEFTYFTKESEDALIRRPLPPSFGLTGDLNTTGAIFDNLGSVRNWGTELALNARVLNMPSAALNLRLSATTLDNRIEDLGEDIEPITFNRGNQQHKQGLPTGAFVGRRYEIINPGEQRLLTADDIRVIDEDSAVFFGHSLPTNSQSLSGDLSLFRNLVTISGLVERRAGHKQYNFTEAFRCQTGYNRGVAGGAGGQCAAVADPRASMEDQARFIANRFHGVTSGYIEDADFIKLRELALTLGVPEQLASRFDVLRGASVTLSGRNLATWTDYTGLDPEINESGGDSEFTQGEFNTQPPLRYLTLRFNFSF